MAELNGVVLSDLPMGYAWWVTQSVCEKKGVEALFILENGGSLNTIDTYVYEKSLPPGWGVVVNKSIASKGRFDSLVKATDRAEKNCMEVLNKKLSPEVKGRFL